MRSEVFQGLVQVYSKGQDREVVLDRILERCRSDSSQNQASRQTITRLFYGSLRFNAALWEQAKSLRKNFTLPRDLRSLLVMTLYQLGFMDSIPDYAAINEAIKLIPRKYSGLKGFFTWTLREFQRRPELLEDLNTTLPAWYRLEMERVFKSEIIEDWKKRLLRVPSSCFYLPQGEAPKGARRLTEEIPCYAIAELSLEVQSRILSQQGVICDPLSMVVPHYFSDLKTGSFLDLCAAPGGKFLVAASRFPDLNCVAVEKSKRRFEFLKQRLEDFDGLKHRADLCHMDALDYLQDCKKTGRKFERILLDAPCSALGTVLNHPEYLCTKSDKKPKYLEELQQELLSKSLAVLSDDGELIYVVCTFSPEETELQIQKLCTSHAVESIPLKPLAGERHQQADHGRFLMAGDLGNQIFYVALLKRVPSNSGER